jgi:hypothetical protein
MNQLATTLLIGSFISWCVSLAHRGRVWAFAAWFPFAATSAIATLAWIAIIPQLGNTGGGAGAGFAALGAAMAFLLLLISPFLLFISIRFRPVLYTPVVVIPTILCIAIGIPAVWSAVAKASVVPVHLTFQASDGTLISGVRVSYETRNRVNGFSAPVLSGEVISQSDGSVTVFTRDTHELNLRFSCDGFSPTGMRIDRAFPRLGRGRQCKMNWQISLPEHRWPQGKSETFYLPIADELSGVVYLPRINQTDLPYPNY